MKKQVFSSGVFVCFIFLVINCFVVEAQTSKASGNIRGKQPPLGQCNQENDSDCCKQGKMYPIYMCSPPVSGHTKATLTLNSFEKNGDGGALSECDHKYHDYQPPSPNNVVDASKAVSKALGVPEDDWGELDIYWSDA